MPKKYIVSLSKSERQELEEFVSVGKTQAYRIKHANILLAVDANRLSMSDEDAAKTFGCHVNTVANVRQRFVEEGIGAAIERKKQKSPSRQRVLDGAGEAKLIQLACSEPPKGRSRWTLELLASELVALKIVDSISDQTVRRTLKKMTSSLTCENAG
jgi:transposase